MQINHPVRQSHRLSWTKPVAASAIAGEGLRQCRAPPCPDRTGDPRNHRSVRYRVGGGRNRRVRRSKDPCRARLPRRHPVPVAAGLADRSNRPICRGMPRGRRQTLPLRRVVGRCFVSRIGVHSLESQRQRRRVRPERLVTLDVKPITLRFRQIQLRRDLSSSPGNSIPCYSVTGRSNRRSVRGGCQRGQHGVRSLRSCARAPSGHWERVVSPPRSRDGRGKICASVENCVGTLDRLAIATDDTVHAVFR